MMVAAAPVPAAAASTAESVGLSPSKIAIVLDAGKQTTIKIAAKNTMTTPIVIEKIDAWDFAIDQSGNPTPIPGQDAARLRGAAAWMLVPGKPITIGPGQEVVFPVKVVVPKDARTGTHYTFVRATINPNRKDKNGLKVNLQLNTLVLVTVGAESAPAKLHRRVTVKKTSMPGLMFKGATLSYLIANSGNVHETIDGRVELLSGGQAIDRVSMSPHIVLPGADRLFTCDWTRLPLAGKYILRATFTGGPKPLVTEKAVWIFSPVFLIIVGAGLILIIWAVTFVRRFARDFQIVRKES
jgi:hypothetical protein